MADKLDGIIISEILADNAGGQATDVDGDGSANKADEFVEIQNTTNSAISLNGFELWSEKQGQLYAFGATDTIAAGGTATVLGEYTGTPPADFYSAGTNNNINWLPDGEGQKFDSIFLVNANTGEYVVLSYGNPPRAPTLPSGFPGTTQIGAGEQMDSSAPNGVPFVRDANGDFTEGTTPTPGTPGTPCFCPGTLIETLNGPVPVEALQPGDMLMTKDEGPQPLLAVRQYEVCGKKTLFRPECLPIRLPRGAFGNTRCLDVSPNHCVLIAAPQASLLFGGREVLVAAKHLLSFGAVRIGQKGAAQTYFHLVLKEHSILRAHGIWTESLFLGNSVRSDDTHLPDWTSLDSNSVSQIRRAETARPVLRAFEAALLMGEIHEKSVAQAA